MSFAPKLLSTAILMALAGTAVAAVKDPGAANRALTNIHARPAAVLANPGDRFTVKNTVVDANGNEHVRFTRTYGGLDVIGGDFVTHSRGGALRSVSQTLGSSLRPNLHAAISADTAIEFAGVAFGTGFEGLPTARQVIFALHTRPTLAYEVVFAGQKANGDPTEMHFFVDAANGRILDKWDMVHTIRDRARPGGGTTTPPPPPPPPPVGGAAIGLGIGQVYGTNPINTASLNGSYNLTDTTRGDGAMYDANGAAYNRAAGRATLFVDADNTWGNGNLVSDRATAAVDAAYGVAKTFDFYKNVMGRNGIFNDGKGVKSYVHVGRGWVNAAWYADAMYYGDGGGSYLPLVAIDVAGHEMSHGVTQAVNGLVYSGDAGGLNEASSDIMGTLVEFYANNPSDTPDYTIGEEIYATQSATKALRYMFKPSGADASYDCYPSAGFGGVDPHYSSGPANHFFYLLAVGAVNPAGFSYTPAQLVCNGNTTLNAIGNAKAGQIWYRAMDLYFTSGTTYPQARAGTISAAEDLYGVGSAEANAVKAAWSAVGVN
jgi:Zn-dependent metalloprotease